MNNRIRCKKVSVIARHGPNSLAKKNVVAFLKLESQSFVKLGDSWK